MVERLRLFPERQHVILLAADRVRALCEQLTEVDDECVLKISDVPPLAALASIKLNRHEHGDASERRPCPSQDAVTVVQAVVREAIEAGFEAVGRSKVARLGAAIEPLRPACCVFVLHEAGSASGTLV